MRGLDPLNDITRFYAAVLFFLILLLTRLAPLFCSLSFNIGWWAYVFPMGSAATMTIQLSSLYDNNPVMLAFSCAGAAATTSLFLLVGGLTMRAIWSGDIPKSDEALHTHIHAAQLHAALAGAEGSVDEPELDNSPI